MKHSSSTMVLTANGKTNARDENSNSETTLTANYIDNDEQLASTENNNDETSTCYNRRRFIYDILLIISVILPIFVCENMIEPFERGFFCNDESIRYPYYGNTVGSLGLAIFSIVVPLLGFSLVEFWRQRYCTHWTLTHTSLPSRGMLPFRLGELFRQCCFYLFGLALTLNATEVGKYTVGRLRPHFFNVCKPRMLDGSSCADEHNQERYIERFYCTGLQEVGGGRFTQNDLREARLSFPSGHSSFVWYSMIYLVIYMQQRLPRDNNAHLGRFLLQFLCLCTAWFVALTRVMDNFHHSTDVLAGSILGALAAILTSRYLAKLCMPRFVRQIHLPNSSTKPPFTLKEVSVLTTQ